MWSIQYPQVVITEAPLSFEFLLEIIIQEGSTPCVDVIEDNVITENEYKSMKEFEGKLLSEANFKAWEDGQISDDEKKMLNMLKKIVKDIGTLEYE